MSLPSSNSIGYAFVLVALSVVVFTSVCNHLDRSTEWNESQYYPLKVGNKWSYLGLHKEDTLDVMVIGRTSVRELNFVEIGEWISGPDGRSKIGQYFLSVDGGKISGLPALHPTEDIAVYEDNFDEWVSDYYIVDAPIDSLWIRKDFRIGATPNLLSNLHVKLKSRSDSLLTPAGSFRGCLRFEIEADDLHEAHWLAPGVGVVRRESYTQRWDLFDYAVN
jgi:hypothetical protein